VSVHCGSPVWSKLLSPICREGIEWGRRAPDPPIRGGLSRLSCGAVWARPVDMGGGSWGEVPECCKIFHPLGVKVAIRIRKKQGELFEDGSAVRHFAVLSNRWELKAARLIEGHREKAGTIEFVQDVIKNDLGGGVLPSKYFGANAAWLRLAVIAHNVLGGAEAPGLAPGTADGPPQTLALPDLQHPGAAGPPRAPSAAAIGHRGPLDGGRWGGPAVAAREPLNRPAPKCRAYPQIGKPPFRNSERSVFIFGAAQPAAASGRLLQP
jgi:hypothetical protein